MKIIICKVYGEENIERRIGQLVSKEKRQGTGLRLFCVDEQMHQKFVAVHLPSELPRELANDLADEPSWEQAGKLCDKWRASYEGNDALKFWGINVIEYPVSYQVFITKFCKLCDKLASENCETVIVVLSKHLNERLPNINSIKIRTIIYGRPTNEPVYYSLLFLRVLVNKIKGMPGFLTGTRRKPVPTEDRQQKLALFVIPSAGGKMLYLYAPTALAIIERCRSSGIAAYVVMEDKHSLPDLHRQGVEGTVIPSLPLSQLMKYLLLLYRLKKHIGSLEGISNNQEEFSAESLGKRKLLEALPSLCYSAVTCISYFRRIFKISPPDIVCIIPDTLIPQKMAAAVARKYGIPSITVHIAIMFDHPILRIGRLVTDKAAVMGEKVRDIYLKKGIAPERIVVTGIAHYDRIFQRNSEQDKETLSRLKIDPGKRIVVFATEATSFQETSAMIKGVIECVLKLEDTLLVIKVHPREEIELYQKIAESYHNPRIHVVRDMDLYALLSSCQLLIAQFSTTGLEAMMFDKPVVTINLFGQAEPVPYVREGAALGVYRYEDIEPAIRKALFDMEIRHRLKEQRTKFVYDYAYKSDGKSSQRIVALMNEMMLQKPKPPQQPGRVR